MHATASRKLYHKNLKSGEVHGQIVTKTTQILSTRKNQNANLLMEKKKYKQIREVYCQIKQEIKQNTIWKAGQKVQLITTPLILNW